MKDPGEELDLFLFTSKRGMSHVVVISPNDLERAAWATTLCSRGIYPTKKEQPVLTAKSVTCSRCRVRMAELSRKKK